MLTRDYRETLRERAQDEPEFGHELLKGAVRCMLNGETEVGQIILSDYINSGRCSGDLERMLNPDGDPQADNLLRIVAAMTKQENIALDVRVVPRGQYERQLAASVVWYPDPCDTVVDCDAQHR